MKKVTILLVMMAILAVLSGCGKTKLNDLNQETLFNAADRYYVYFYRDDCPACQEVYPVIVQYLEALQEEKWQDKRPLFGFDISTGSNNESIYRAYSGSDGQGTEGRFFVDAATSFNQLYIAATPSLISITKTGNTIVARYEAQGADAITRVLATHLGVEYVTPENG